MVRIARLFLYFIFALLIAGCAMNAVKSLRAGDVAQGDSAVVVYGVKVEGYWNYPKFSILLDEYDLAKQNITGNCFRFNRTEAVVTSEPGEMKYFAFEVPPGYYVYSPFHLTRLSGDFLAFEAVSGRSVYIGDFVLKNNQAISLYRGRSVDTHGIEKLWPGLAGKISSAEAIVVRPPFLFVCMP